MSSFPVTRREIWRLRRAWTDWRIAETESKLRALRVRLWHIDNEEPRA